MACDICGNTGTHLESLRDEYQTDKIKQICSKCSKEVNGHLRALRDMTQKMNRTWVQRFMAVMKERLSV